MSTLQPPLRRLIVALAAAAAALLLVGATGAEAGSVITVDTLKGGVTDDGNCTFDEAIKAANTDQAVDKCPAGSGDDTINIGVSGTIKSPEHGGYWIRSNMAIHGNGADAPAGFAIEFLKRDPSTGAPSSAGPPVSAVTLTDLTTSGVSIGASIDGWGGGEEEDKPFTITLENLHIHDSVLPGISYHRNGDTPREGKISVSNSVVENNNGGIECRANFVGVTLEVRNSIIRDNNNDPNDNEVAWGAISNTCGHVRVVDSTVSGNKGLRGGIHADAGVWEGSSVATGTLGSTHTEIINTTVTGNSGTLYAGGVTVGDTDESWFKGAKPVLSIVHSTIAGNTGGGDYTTTDGKTYETGGGIYAYYSAEVSIVNSVVADNDGTECIFNATMVVNSGNASSDDSCGFAHKNVKAGLQPLRDNGGAAPLGPNGSLGYVTTMAIGESSSLYGAADRAFCGDKDARGAARTWSGCDIGAFEASRTSPEDGPPRVEGTNRYLTAVEVSKATFAPGVETVYIATGVNFPDALAGSAASGGDGPILLVTKDSIGGATLTELKRLKPKRIVVLGGAGVVSTAVEATLKNHATTTRQAGADRYTTAAAISAKHFEPGTATAYVATGEDFPDALTGGPAAAKLGGPILLTQKDKLPSATVSELKRLKPKDIAVLGGTGVVSAEVEKALAVHTSGKVTRLAGADRYATGAAIAMKAFKPGVPVVYVATGANFPDALAGGAAGAFRDGPVLLVAGENIPKATKDELARLKPNRVIVLGGAAAVPETVRKALAAYLPKSP